MSSETNVIDKKQVVHETNVTDEKQVVHESVKKENDEESADGKLPVSFFEETDSSEPKKTPVHPFEEYDDFKKHPPIPVFNYIINSKTGELIEDKTGEP